MEATINLTIPDLKELLQKCSGKRIALDTETTGLKWWEDRLITVGFFCPDADLCGSIDISGEWSEELQQILRDTVKESLGPGTTVIMHNAKFDTHFLRALAPELGWNIIDTTVLIHLIDSRYPKGMARAEGILLGTNSKREAVEEAPARKKIWDWPPDTRQNYCVNDCRVTYQFAEVLYPFVKELKLDKLFAKDMKYLNVLCSIERSGMLTNTAFIREAAESMKKHRIIMEDQLYDACGKKFNWRSPKQLSKAIYEDMGISKPVNPWTGTQGKFHTKFNKTIYNDTMTNTFILMEMAHHPLGELISAIREAAVLGKTLNNWLELVDKNDYIHTNFNITGTRTGRLSSSKPNLQNVASDVRSRFTSGIFSGGLIRTEEYNLRNAFIARPGYIFLSIDYKQMEMRMFGILSGDSLLLDALKSGVDIHRWIALQCWGDCGEETNKIHREWSKVITFGLIYGMQANGLQFKLNMSKAQAQKVTDDYWSRFPRIRPWMGEIIEECSRNHYVRYWSGRIWREEDQDRFYKSANAAIQGGCADLLSIAAIRVFNWLQPHGPDWGRIVNLVHDEIIIEIPEEDINQAAIEMGEIMKVEDLFKMPFLIDYKKGASYGSLEKFVPEKGQS